MSQVTNYSVQETDSNINMSELATKLENIFAAVGSMNRGSTAPSNPFNSMVWADTSVAGNVALRIYTPTAGWVSIFTVNESTGVVSFSLGNGTVVSDMLAALAVTTAKLAANSVTLAKLARVGNAGDLLSSNGAGADPSMKSLASLDIATLTQVNATLANYAALVSAQTFSGAQKGSVISLTSTSNQIAINLALGNYFSHTLSENTTLNNPTNLIAGQGGVITFIQHASSPKTLLLGSYWVPTDGVAPSLSTTPGAINMLSFYANTSTYISCSLARHGVA